jgi:hypothetical protein
MPSNNCSSLAVKAAGSNNAQVGNCSAMRRRISLRSSLLFPSRIANAT